MIVLVESDWYSNCFEYRARYVTFGRLTISKNQLVILPQAFRCQPYQANRCAREEKRQSQSECNPSLHSFRPY